MINYLIGKPKILEQRLCLLVGGVGYEVTVNPQLLGELGDLTETALFIYTFVREDRLELYGFSTLQDRHIFELLIGVSGVGPKTAILMFGGDSAGLIKAVQEADLAYFKSIPRVGQKLAQKIIIELKSKLGTVKDLNLTPLSPFKTELAKGLEKLGFEENRVRAVLNELPADQQDLEAALKFALKELARERLKK